MKEKDKTALMVIIAEAGFFYKEFPVMQSQVALQSAAIISEVVSHQ